MLLIPKVKENQLKGLHAVLTGDLQSNKSFASSKRRLGGIHCRICSYIKQCLTIA
jgi:hypothetical protein